MRKRIHRFGALLLVVCIMLNMCMPAMAAESKTEVISGTFYFDPHEGSAAVGDRSDSYVYSDDYFSGSSYEANAKLATMSMQLAASSISSNSYDRSAEAYKTRSKNVEDLLGQLGFCDIAVNENYNKKMSENTMGVAVAYKQLDDDTILFAIVPRSAGYEIEWSGNFNVGTEADGLHAGFKTARNIALDFAKEYVSERSDIFSGKNLKVWTVGYSRGAAVANLIGAAAAEGYNFNTAASPVSASSKNVYAYTFGTPNNVIPTDSSIPKSDTYKGIHNYYSDYDPVKMAPLAEWGFTHYGQDTLLPVDSAEAKTKMLSLLKELNPDVYAAYTNGGDPDTFTAMKIDSDTLSIVPDTDAGMTQKEFFTQRISYLKNHLAGTREVYASEYQDMLCTLMVLYFGGDASDTTRLAANIKENKTDAAVTAASIAAYALLQCGADQFGANTQLDVNGLSDLVAKMLYAWLAGRTGSTDQLSADALKAAAENAVQAVLGSKTAEDGSDAGKASVGTYSHYADIAYSLAVANLKSLLDYSVDKTTFTSSEKENLANRLKNEQTFAAPFVKFIAAVAFGTELSAEQKEANDLGELALLQAGTAVTLYANSGKFMRVHNNEVIVSWLRTMPGNDEDSDSGDKDNTSTDKYSTFSDLTAGAWYQSGVKYVLDKGLMNGISKDKFAPDADMTRAQLVNILWRLDGEKNVNYAMTFKDVKSDKWYTEAVRWASSEGIVTGYSSEKFGPDAAVTREQLAAILWRYAKHKGTDVSVGDDTNIMDYDDVKQISSYAVPAMQWAVGAGIINGMEDDTLQPNAPTTRAQIAVIMERFNG